MKTIYIATDHAGFELKNILVPYLTELGYTVFDCGASVYDALDDYPDFVSHVSKTLSSGAQESVGIVLGGSGTGEAMVVNAYPRVRGCVYYGGNLEIVQLARLHNNANVLSLGARFVGESEAKEAVRLFLETNFSGEERHVRRIEKLEHLKQVA